MRVIGEVPTTIGEAVYLLVVRRWKLYRPESLPYFLLIEPDKRKAWAVWKDEVRDPYKEGTRISRSRFSNRGVEEGMVQFVLDNGDNFLTFEEALEKKKAEI